MLTDKQLTEVVAKLAKAQAYQRGAWQKVIDDGRQYAQMKAHGPYMENGHSVSVCFSSIKDMEEKFKRNLLSSVERAFAEDAQMGITISETLG